MKTTYFKNKRLTVVALMLVIPTVYFILIAVLKYIFQIDGPFDALEPTLEQLGISGPVLGWNINLLILFGPLIAFVISILQVLKIDWKMTKEDLHFHFTIQKNWFPIMVALISFGVLVFLFLYGLGENYNG